MLNSLFAGNSGAGGLVNSLGSVAVSNCTFAENSASAHAGLSNSGSATVDNCLFWRNRSGSGMTDASQLGGFNSPVINYSIVQGWTGSMGGVGNSGDDPLLVEEGSWEDPGTPDDFLDDVWIEGDYRLRAESPAIDGGNPDPDLLVDPDLDGHPRVLCGRVDMGAYEFGIGDYDCDRVVDLTDFAMWNRCMTGPAAENHPLTCEAFDFDADDNIDLTDFAALQVLLGSGG